MASAREEHGFRLLGPVQVTTPDGPVAFARRQHRDLLAFLLMRTEHVVTLHQIVDAMWGELVPRTAALQVKNMLSALRGALTTSVRTLAIVERQPAGYRLRVMTGQVDLSTFATLVSRADAQGAAEEKAGLLRQALAEWRGEHALCGARAHFAEAARAQLAERRAAALEALFEAELERGNHMRIVAGLTTALADHPGRERLVAQLMLALHRGGRPMDALSVFRRARLTLADEFGLEPGSALRDLERLILLDDPSLRLPPDTAHAEPATDGGHRVGGRPYSQARTAASTTVSTPLTPRPC
jgi:DNA-binding SARP family transcriptional activator